MNNKGSKAECIDYLSNWSGILKEKIADGDPKSPLYEEQVYFLDKAVEELKK